MLSFRYQLSKGFWQCNKRQHLILTLGIASNKIRSPSSSSTAVATVEGAFFKVLRACIPVPAAPKMVKTPVAILSGSPIAVRVSEASSGLRLCIISGDYSHKSRMSMDCAWAVQACTGFNVFRQPSVTRVHMNLGRGIHEFEMSHISSDPLCKAGWFPLALGGLHQSEADKRGEYGRFCLG
jgi:hypothetical protein